LILSLFAAVMLAASASMIRRAGAAGVDIAGPSTARTGIVGAAVGMMTGFVGAGGGFLIVPALVNGLKLPMQVAVGTSLLVIAMNSLSGFGIDLAAGMQADWGLMLRFSGAALVGIVLGACLHHRVPSAKLKPAFGWFVLVLGTAMAIQQAIELG
jgi:uncharacterized protein